MAFLALLRWPGFRSFEFSAEELLLRLPLVGSEVFSNKTAGCEVAVARRQERKTDRAVQATFVDQEKGWLAIGDVRIFDAPGAASPTSGLERLVATFAERGADGISRVHGEFAFVILDWRRAIAYAFRDQVGSCPLYFRVFPQGIAFASDLRHLLGFRPVADEPLDAQRVGDYLGDALSSSGHTFFENIRQLVAGHRLEAKVDRLEQSRYWVPETAPLTSLTYGEMVEEWRRLFHRAVTLRLDSDYPMASYLSGGMDSGSIVGAAHMEYVNRPQQRPPFFTLSARFPGTTYDETELIEDATRAVPLFRPLTWDGTAPDSQDLESPLLAMPGLREGLGRGPQTDMTLIRRHDIRTVFSGFAGDELGWSHGYFRDLVARCEFRHLAEELRFFPSWRARARRLRADLRGVTTTRTGAKQMPTWAGKRLREVTQEDHLQRDLEPVFRSFSQAAKWSMVNLPRVAYVIELKQTRLADVGARLALPYRDLALIEFVMRIPWRLNAPRGDVRKVQRDAVTPYLSPGVAQNRHKTLFGAALRRQVQANENRIQALLDDSQWVSSAFILQGEARAAFRALKVADPFVTRMRDWLPFWRIAVFEAWHREILHYHGPRENDDARRYAQ